MLVKKDIICYWNSIQGSTDFLPHWYEQFKRMNKIHKIVYHISLIADHISYIIPKEKKRKKDFKFGILLNFTDKVPFFIFNAVLQPTVGCGKKYILYTQKTQSCISIYIVWTKKHTISHSLKKQAHQKISLHNVTED